MAIISLRKPTMLGVLCEWLMDTFVDINARPEAFPNLVLDPRAAVAESCLTFGRKLIHIDQRLKERHFVDTSV